MHFETWQIVCLIIGGGIWAVFEVLSAIKNNKARKAKKAAQNSSFDFNPDPDLDDVDKRE